ncbi:hypothetical protein AXF42_Ash020289 [Apostasia shenzhenica]|uniref:Uncharacterized protein n=1 Tax=Apostasia shenzhenica TaxID=1088818 RepID=A0A2H9ZSY5_9ASPA|nr:hypothetical protein AXF42_Ash020289 [Apostasia shenzhenica]
MPDAAKEEIRRIKEEEEQLMREALGLAPKRTTRPQGNRLDKHEYAELIKRGSAAEDLGGGHAEAAQVKGLGLYKIPKNKEQSSSPLQENMEISSVRDDGPSLHPPTVSGKDGSEADESRKKKRQDKRMREDENKRDKSDRKRSHGSDDRRRKQKEGKRRHGSD